MSIFKLEINPDEMKHIGDEIENRVRSRQHEHGNFVKKENELAASTLNYAGSEVEELSYELFRAREYVKIFPEDDPFSPVRTSGVRKFYHRVVRRLLRRQIVFNEFMLSASEEIWRKLKNLEDRISAIEKNKPGKGSGHGNE